MTEPTSTPTEPANPPEFLTVDEAAALLRVNRKTLYESIRLGQVRGSFAWGNRCGSDVLPW
ncbi:Helix-turn-helix domain-containing protein [Corallococcus soli]